MNLFKALLITTLFLFCFAPVLAFNLESNVTEVNNVCTGIQNKMTTSVYPCRAQDVDGKDITQYVNFTWTGGQEIQTNWGFVYDQPLEDFTIYKWDNSTYNKTFCGEYIANTTTCNESSYYNITKVIGWVNVIGKVDYSGNNLLDKGKDYYFFKNITLKPDKIIQTKWVFTPKDNALSGKWHQFGWMHGTTIKDAITTGQYYYMDPWWNSDWDTKRKLTIDHTKVDYSYPNLTVMVNFSSFSGLDWNAIQADGEDIRFVNAAEDAELAQERTIYADGSGAVYYVRVESVSSSSDTDFYMYYNNTGASAATKLDAWGPEYFGVYHFEDYYNDTKNVGTEHDATSASETTITQTGYTGKGVLLDGNNDVVSFNYAWGPLMNISIMGFFKPSSATTDSERTVMGLQGLKTGYGDSWYNDYWQGEAMFTDPLSITGYTTALTTEWTHASAFIRMITGEDSYFKVNDIYSNTTSSTSLNPGIFKIGAIADGYLGGYSALGTLDEVRVLDFGTYPGVNEGGLISEHYYIEANLMLTYGAASVRNTAPTLDSVADIPDPVKVGSDVTFVVNWTDVDWGVGDSVKIEICKTDELTGVNCTSKWCDSDATWDDTSPTTCTYTALAGDAGANNYYAFVCDDEDACSSSTSGVFNVESITLTITSPSNATYMTSNLTFNYTVTSCQAEPYNCTRTINGLNSTTDTVTNGTVNSIDFTEYTPGYYNYSVNCYDGVSNKTESIGFTVQDINFTLTNGQNSTAYEGVTNFYNVTIGINPDIISDLNASLYWNDTHIGYNYKGKINSLTYWFNETFMLPIVTTNNTSINTKWNVTKLYINGSSYVENSSNTAQACFHAWDWDATTYSVNLLERSLNDISVNVSKLGGVGDPVNTTISAALVWNGSPSTMINTMNTSTLLGYSNTTRVPRISAGYNWTFGWNVTLNYSINHGILGYRSRIDTNSTYNYTQTGHQAWLGNCSTGVGTSALIYYFRDEGNDSAVYSNLEAEMVLNYEDWTSTYTFNYLNDTSFTFCVYPKWYNYTFDGLLEYGGLGYGYRTWQVSDASLDNITDNFYLYSLISGSNVVFTVEDSGTNPQPNLILNISKWGPSGYLPVVSVETDAFGKALAYLELNKKYRIIVYDAGVEVTVVEKYITSTSETIKINFFTLSAYYNHTFVTNVTFTFNNVTNVTSFYIQELSNVSLTSATLTAKRIRGGLVSTTATITNTTTAPFYIIYVITDLLNNDTYIFQITGAFIDDINQSIYYKVWSPSAFTNLFGNEGLLFAFILTGTLSVTIGYILQSGFGLSLGALLGLILSTFIGLTPFSWTTLTGLGVLIALLFYLGGRKHG